jgi:chemotaxis protein methyltransferase CheR
MAFTYFFRDDHVLELVVKLTAPALAARSVPRIWDAGCAMGQEPYTLCMMYADVMGRFAFNNLRVYATDLDNSDLFGNIIKVGIYPKEELERMPRAAFEKYFEATDSPGHFRVTEQIRNRIVYQKHDLLTQEEIGRDFSLVVCKNVLLHFQAGERVEVIRMFHRALAPGGFFATEQTQKMPAEVAHLFTLLVADAQIFQKAEGAACAS